ncbi:hypothetical protein AAG570_011717 [Ranatra chinensis]|uniref:Uncharacterized protein n=1 Tax=Ranatra chinensis TaxID=642074 RepID=A0ABD0Z513_9HEMI
MASKRRNMFQKNKTQETTENGCKVNVTSVSFTALGNARFYSEDLLASSLLLEKKYISEEFRTALLGETLGSMVQVVFEESMDAYMCKGRSELVDKLKRILPFIREESDQIAAQSAL